MNRSFLRKQVAHLDVRNFDRVISLELLAADAQQPPWIDPVAAQESVQGAGWRISVLAGAAHEHAPATASQNESGIEPGRARAHDDYIANRTQSAHWPSPMRHSLSLFHTTLSPRTSS